MTAAYMGRDRGDEIDADRRIEAALAAHWAQADGAVADGALADSAVADDADRFVQRVLMHLPRRAAPVAALDPQEALQRLMHQRRRNGLGMGIEVAGALVGIAVLATSTMGSASEADLLRLGGMLALGAAALALGLLMPARG